MWLPELSLPAGLAWGAPSCCCCEGGGVAALLQLPPDSESSLHCREQYRLTSCRGGAGGAQRA